MAVELAQAGIQTTLIPDCAVFAMMARVNKVGCPAGIQLKERGLLAVSLLLRVLSAVEGASGTHGCTGEQPLTVAHVPEGRILFVCSLTATVF